MNKIILNLIFGATLASILMGCANSNQPLPSEVEKKVVDTSKKAEDEKEPETFGDKTMALGKTIMSTNLTPVFVIAVPIYGLGKLIKTFEEPVNEASKEEDK